MIMFFSIIPFYLCPHACVNILTDFFTQKIHNNCRNAWRHGGLAYQFFVRSGEPFCLCRKLRFSECNNGRHIKVIQGPLWTVQWLFPPHKVMKNRVFLYLHWSPPCWGPLLTPFLPPSRFGAVSTLILPKALSIPPFYHHHTPTGTGWDENIKYFNT